MKQIIPFLFIIENVKNDDKYISLINNFMQYITAKIKDDESFNNDSYEPVINILLLGKTARWFNETPNFISISDFVYKDISPEDDDIDYTSLKVKMVEHGFASNAIRNTITYYLAHLGKKGNYQHIPDDCFLKTIFVNFNPNNKRELLSSDNNSFSTSVFEEKEFFHFYDLYIKEFADTFFNIKNGSHAPCW